MIFALYFGGFGATLLADPSMYFAGGALPYWTTPLDNEAGDIQNRMFGAQLLGIGVMAFLHGGEALVKKLVTADLSKRYGNLKVRAWGCDGILGRLVRRGRGEEG